MGSAKTTQKYLAILFAKKTSIAWRKQLVRAWLRQFESTFLDPKSMQDRGGRCLSRGKIWPDGWSLVGQFSTGALADLRRERSCFLLDDGGAIRLRGLAPYGSRALAGRRLSSTDLSC
jgi:hypothetical protein